MGQANVHIFAPLSPFHPLSICLLFGGFAFVFAVSVV